MRGVARSVRRLALGALAPLLVSLVALLLAQPSASAQRQLVDPRTVSLRPADLPRGFSVVDGETAFEPLRLGQDQTDADVVGVTLRTVLERPRTLENLQSGPLKVSQMIARSDDPTRATFSLAAQREYNARENGFEPIETCTPADELLCLVRRDGPFVEYRVDAVKNADTLVSTTALGLPSALSLDGAIALSRVSLGRYDEQLTELLAAQPPSAALSSQGTEVRAVATATPAPPPPLPTAPPAAPPTAQAAAPAPPAPSAKLPARFDDRLRPAWSELMTSTATTRSGEKMTAFVRRVVEAYNVKVTLGTLRPNVGGETQATASMDGDKAKIIESGIVMNRDVVLTESPRVLAAMLAHEITHANQPIMQAGGKPTDCAEAEVEAYGVQARVWAAFWGQGQRPGQTSWERSTNEIEKVWRDGGDDGLRQMVREDIGMSSHSCFG